jgi:hypothetical protein
MSESFVDQYCAIVNEGAEFDDPRLAQLRERMTDAEIDHVVGWLDRSGAAALKEADDRRRPN